MTYTRRLNSASWQFKASSGGSYAAVNGVINFTLPSPDSGTEDITPTDATVAKEGNTLINWTDLEMEIDWDTEDTVHQAMIAAIGSQTEAYVKVTLSGGRTIEYVGNAKAGKHSQGNARSYHKKTFGLHPNSTPTEVALS